MFEKLRTVCRYVVFLLIFCLTLITLSSCNGDLADDGGIEMPGRESVTETETRQETYPPEHHSEEPPEDTEVESLTLETDAQPEEREIFTLGYYDSTDGTYIEMDMNNVMQMSHGMPNGCEVVSLCLAMRYYGYTVDPVYMFENYMPYGPNDGTTNPFEKYIGDPCTYTGFGCYAPCVVETANAYITDKIDMGIRAYDVSGSTIADIERYLSEGHPVILWATLGMGDSSVLDTWEFDGVEVSWYSASHCVVLIGYEDDSFIVCDPLVGKVHYKKADVEKAYKLIYSQAVIFRGAGDAPT